MKPGAGLNASSGEQKAKWILWPKIEVRPHDPEQKSTSKMKFSDPKQRN
jgi:hypothetical protein